MTIVHQAQDEYFTPNQDLSIDEARLQGQKQPKTIHAFKTNKKGVQSVVTL